MVGEAGGMTEILPGLEGNESGGRSGLQELARLGDINHAQFVSSRT